MPDALKPEQVERIAELARLALTDREKELFARQLTRVLEYFGQLAALDTRGVPAMARVEEGARAERADEPRPSLDRDEALRNAPDAPAGLFGVPKVI